MYFLQPGLWPNFWKHFLEDPSHIYEENLLLWLSSASPSLDWTPLWEQSLVLMFLRSARWLQKRLHFFMFSHVNTVFFGHRRTSKRLRSILVQQQLIVSILSIHLKLFLPTQNPSKFLTVTLHVACNHVNNVNYV